MDLFRKIVSRDKKRLIAGNFDLDISYITPRVMAMSFPGQGIESMYRNSKQEVIAYLQKHHSGDYLVINLSNREYANDNWSGQVIHHLGWEDHNCPALGKLFMGV